MSRPRDTAEEVEVASAEDLRAWLAGHHGRMSGVWLVSFKKAVPDRYLPYGHIVDELLCWGWVDSLPREKDARRSMRWIAPRKAGSNWSRVNKEKVARLEAEGRMQAPGRATVERAKADGTWSALDAVEALQVPDDLALALGDARTVWDAYPRSVRRGVLELLQNAKTADTRARRIAAIVTAAEAGERPFQWAKR